MQKRHVKLAVQAVVLTVVAWGVVRAVNNARDDLARQQVQLRQRLEQLQKELDEARAAGQRSRVESLQQDLEQLRRQQQPLANLRPQWLVFSGLIYLIGWLPAGLFWLLVLRAWGQAPGWGRGLRAYYIGHLGKYVPGKAMVVVLRAGLLRGPQVDASAAAAAVFVETLTIMAAGAMVSAAYLLVARPNSWLLAAALLLMLGAGVPSIPPVFRRLVRALQVRRAAPNIEAQVDRLTWRLLARGWLLGVAGWSALGASLYCVFAAVPQSGVQLPQLPLMIGAVALSAVAGFLSLLPGGIGIRELVITELLAPQFGASLAIVAAVILRLTWLVSELLASGILYAAFRSSTAPPRSHPEQ